MILNYFVSADSESTCSVSYKYDTDSRMGFLCWSGGNRFADDGFHLDGDMALLALAVFKTNPDVETCRTLIDYLDSAVYGSK